MHGRLQPHDVTLVFTWLKMSSIVLYILLASVIESILWEKVAFSYSVLFKVVYSGSDGHPSYLVLI